MASTKASWGCVRYSEVPMWSLVGLDELDRLDSVDVARIATKPSYWRRRGYAFELKRHDGSRFQLPRQASTDDAERDWNTFLAFTRAGHGELTLKAPDRLKDRLLIGLLTIVVLGAIAWNVRRWWRGTASGRPR